LLFYVPDAWNGEPGATMSTAPLEAPMSASRVRSGAPGELSCVIPRLPPLPGRYVVRAMINEHGTCQVLAEYGRHGQARGLAQSAQIRLGQLTAIDVDWECGVLGYKRRGKVRRAAGTKRAAE
jgi:hypothetical protein